MGRREKGGELGNQYGCWCREGKGYNGWVGIDVGVCETGKGKKRD